MESTAHERVLIVSRDERLRGLANEMLATKGWTTQEFSDSRAAFGHFCRYFREIPAVIVDGRDDVGAATELVRHLVVVRGDVQPFVLASEAPGALLSAAFLRWFEPDGPQESTLENSAGAPATPTPPSRMARSRSGLMRSTAACRAAS